MNPWNVPVTIRHIIATDVMTSLCKVFISMCYATCYFYTGTFLKSPNIDDMEDKFHICTVSPVVHHASVIVCVIPFSVRWLQCARQQYDSLVKNNKIDRIVWRRRKPHKEKGEDVSSDDKSDDEDNGRSDRSDSNSGDSNSGDSNSGEEENDNPFSDEHEPIDISNTGASSAITLRASPRGSGASLRRVSVVTEPAVVGATTAPAVGVKSSSAKSKRPMLSRSESKETLDPHWCGTLLDKLPSSITRITDILIVWPYTFNILKYSLSIIVVVMGAYPPDLSASSYDTYLVLFYMISVTSTLYSCYWDFKNDWGLFQDRTDWPLLRPQLKYENVIWYYYLCLVLNPIFRCFWTLSFSPNATSPFLSLFELLRRCMWAILRLEWAQINDDKQNARVLVEARDEVDPTKKNSMKRVNSYLAVREASAQALGVHVVTDSCAL